MEQPHGLTAGPREALLGRGPAGLLRREVHTIFCVGKNYAEHAREMGSEPSRGEPTIFLKPAASLRSGSSLELALPAWSTLVHHEVEMCVLLGPDGVEAVGVGLDLTLRDLQNRAKTAGAPWTASKGFPGAALLSEMLPAAGLDLGNLQLRLEVNGALRQSGSTSEMIHSLPALLGHLAERYGLLGGELLYTGTPAGVGPLQPGDRLRCTLGREAEVLASLDVLVLEP